MASLLWFSATQLDGRRPLNSFQWLGLCRSSLHSPPSIYSSIASFTDKNVTRERGVYTSARRICKRPEICRLRLVSFCYYPDRCHWTCWCLLDTSTCPPFNLLSNNIAIVLSTIKYQIKRAFNKEFSNQGQIEAAVNIISCSDTSLDANNTHASRHIFGRLNIRRAGV